MDWFSINQTPWGYNLNYKIDATVSILIYKIDSTEPDSLGVYPNL
jgi:hypothetical protein